MKHVFIPIALVVLIAVTGCLGHPDESQDTSINPMATESEFGFTNPLDQVQMDLSRLAEDTDLEESDVAFLKERLGNIKQIMKDRMGNQERGKMKELFLADEVDEEGILTMMTEKLDQIPDLLKAVQPDLQALLEYFPYEKREQIVQKMEARHERRAEAKEARMKRHHIRMERILDQLELTDEQRTELDTLHKELIALKENHDQESVMHGEIKQAILDGTISSEFLLSKWNTMRPKIEEHFQQMMGFGVRVHDILSADQRTKLVQILEEKRNHHRMHGMMRHH
jgi:DNA repair exonuclease SbcCD ATPase subunit